MNEISNLHKEDKDFFQFHDDIHSVRRHVYGVITNNWFLISAEDESASETQSQEVIMSRAFRFKVVQKM